MTRLQTDPSPFARALVDALVAAGWERGAVAGQAHYPGTGYVARASDKREYTPGRACTASAVLTHDGRKVGEYSGRARDPVVRGQHVARAVHQAAARHESSRQTAAGVRQRLAAIAARAAEVLSR